jgi:predicted ArsR family transcriptional regulator
MINPPPPDYRFVTEEKRIINALYVAHKPLSTKNIAERSEMARQTAKKYLESLNQKGLVSNGKLGKAVFWWLKTNQNGENNFGIDKNQQ